MTPSPARTVKRLICVLILGCSVSLLTSHPLSIHQPGAVASKASQADTDSFNQSLQSPMALTARFPSPPQVGQPVDLIIELFTRVAAPNTQLNVLLSPGIEARSRQTNWQINLAAGETRRLTLPVIITQHGEISIQIDAINTSSGGSTFGARQTLYLEASADGVLVYDLPAELRSGQYSTKGTSILVAEDTIPAPRGPGGYPEDDPKLARLNSPSAPDASQEVITVYGYYYYQDDEGVNQPVPYARVEIYDEDPGDDELLAVTHTDHTGYYERDVTNDAADLRDIYVIISSKDDWSVHVTVHFNEDLYTDQSPTSNNVPDGNHYIGQRVITGNTAPAWHILDKIARDAYVYLLQQVFWVNNYDLRVRWTYVETVDGTYYDLNNEIHMLAVHGWEEDVILHEYGHFVMDKLYATYPPIPNCDPHDWHHSSSDGCAWSEGWATFLEGAIQGHQDYVDDSQAIHYYMEPPNPTMVSDIDEAAVAASLWDIFDPDHGEAHDTLTNGLNGSASNGIWKILSQDQPDTVYEFWDAWFASANGNNCAVHDILEHHLINVFDPCPPSGLAASDGTYTNKVSLDWPNFANATSYQVFRATSLGGSKTQLGVTTTSDFEDSNATPERVYYYFYKACNAIACGDYSAFDTGWREMTIPTNLTASDGTYIDKVRLTWSSVAAATYYRLYSSTSAGGPPGYLTQTTALSYDTNPATPERTYYYWVSACNEYGCSNYSAVESGYREMPTPSDVAASDGTYTSKVRVTWVAVFGATYYKVYRGLSPGSQSYLADSSNAYYDDTTAIPGRTYYYYIQAYNSYGSGAQSSYNSGWREMAVPGGFSASDGAYTDKVRLIWNSVYGADLYDLYRAETPGGATTYLGATSATEYHDSSVTPEKRYYYSIRACNTYRCSIRSTENEGWREMVAPTSLVASDGAYTDKVHLAWGSVSGATHYNVYGGETSTSAGFLGQASSASYDHTSGTPERVYYYHVEACNSYGCGDYSNDDAGWREMPAPTGFSASDGTIAGRVVLNWVSVSGATYYKVFRGPASDNLSFLSDAATSAYSDVAASPGVTYYYAVRACNNYGCGMQSGSDSGWTTVGAVLWVSASDGSYTDKVLVSWASVASADFYHVYRISYYPNQTEMFLGQTTATSYADIYANPEQVYDYYIYACDDSAGCGDPSVKNSGYREMPPANIVASDGSEFAAVYVSWDWVEGAETMQLYRAPTSSGPWTALYQGNNTEYLDTDIIDYAPYYYWVRGCNNFGCGDIITYDSGYCTNTDTPATASDGADAMQVWVSFTEVPTANMGYKIMRSATPDDPGSWAQVAWISGFQSPASAPAEIAGLRYYYAIAACGMAHGQLVCAKQGAYDEGWRTMPAPYSVQASDGTYPGGIQVSWLHDLVNLDPGPDYFEIYRADALDGVKVYLGQQDASPFTAPAAEPGQPYYYWVTACNEYICSPYSEPDSGYTPYPVYLPMLRQGESAAAAQPGALSLAPLLAGIGALGLWRRWIHLPEHHR